MFLEMRREAVDRDEQQLSSHGRILGYEERGTSRRYSYYGLPEKCDTVLFPGCTLPGTRPDKVKKLYHHLLETIPNLGIVLDCCAKPSHDLGREKHFQAMFTEMKEFLTAKGVKKVLVACPNCYKVFSQYGSPLQVATVYQHLAFRSLPETTDTAQPVTVHDPCSIRNEKDVHAAVRTLLRSNELKIEEMKHHGQKTICCGEGGTVECMNPAFAREWGERRREEAGGTRILTYCAGCVNYLGRFNPTSHILDFLFEPEATLQGRVKVSRAPMTYLNRLRLKSYFKRNVTAAVSRERSFSGLPKGQGEWRKRFSFFHK